MKLILALAFGCFSFQSVAQQIPPIGEWREHLPYNSVVDVAYGNGVMYAATPYSLFRVDIDDPVIERLSTVTGLAETGVAAIEFDDAGGRLLIAYSNSNIDILGNNAVGNIPGIVQSAAPGDKRITNIYYKAPYFYLATGVGVIVIDPDRKEVKETWYVSTGPQLKVNDVTADATHFYAATVNGLKRTPLAGGDPANPSNWEPVTVLNDGEISFVTGIGSDVFAERNDSVFVLRNGNWGFFYTGGNAIISLNDAGSGKLSVSERTSSGQGLVSFLNPDGTIFRLLSNTGAVSFPRKAVLLDGNAWVGDQYAGLSQVYPSGHYESYVPNSPQSVASGDIHIHDQKVYVAAGAVNDSWNYQYNGEGLFIFAKDGWSNINRYRFPALDSLLDLVTIVADPSDGSAWAGSFGGGLLHVRNDNSFEIFKQGLLGETQGDPGSYRVAGLAFDSQGNLWISNFGSAEPLRVRRKDGTWKAFSVPYFLFERAVSQIVIDRDNNKWVVSPLGNGVIVFNEGKSLDDVSDDSWRKISAGQGNGNLPSAETWSVAIDKDGMAWIGTSNGIAVIECASEIFSTSCDAIWPVVPNGNFSGYLFGGQQVRSIAVDGANRKWVATPNGVFLVSASGEDIIYHFTEINSPLLSSDVYRVAVDGSSGEVFFATLKGICSFRSTATEASVKNQKPLLIFPNPVPPGFTGTIAIRGLSENAIVKITEPDGRLVFETRALGGQAIWDGKNSRGQRPSTGVYLVLVTDAGGRDNVAGRIVFVR